MGTRCHVCGHQHQKRLPCIPCSFCGKIHSANSARCRSCGVRHHAKCVCRVRAADPAVAAAAPSAVMEPPRAAADGEDQRHEGDTVAASDTSTITAGEGAPSPISEAHTSPGAPLPPPPPAPEDIPKGAGARVVGAGAAIPAAAKPPAHLFTVGIGPAEVVGFTKTIGELAESPIVWTDHELDELNIAFDTDPTLSKLGFKTASGATWVAITVAKKCAFAILPNTGTFWKNCKKKFGGFIDGLKSIGGKIGGIISPKRPDVPKRDGGK